MCFSLQAGGGAPPEPQPRGDSASLQPEERGGWPRGRPQADHRPAGRGAAPRTPSCTSGHGEARSCQYRGRWRGVRASAAAVAVWNLLPRPSSPPRSAVCGLRPAVCCCCLRAVCCLLSAVCCLLSGRRPQTALAAGLPSALGVVGPWADGLTEPRRRLRGNAEPCRRVFDLSFFFSRLLAAPRARLKMDAHSGVAEPTTGERREATSDERPATSDRRPGHGGGAPHKPQSDRRRAVRRPSSASARDERPKMIT